MIRVANINDSENIVRILKRGFPNNIFPYTIYFGEGYKTYVSDLISLKESMVNVRFYVCEDNNNVVGFVEIRQFADVLFLNNIYVEPHHRGNGLGKELLKKSVQMARDNNQESICLDVFSDNIRVLNWYMSLDLKYTYKQLWLLHPLEADAFKDMGFAWWKFINLNEANKLHGIYTISQFVLQTKLMAYSVGRIADTCFKTTEVSILNDMSALYGLYFLDKKRKLLLIGQESQFEKENVLKKGEIIASSLRLAGDIDALLSRLDRSYRRD